MASENLCTYCPHYNPGGRWRSKFQVRKRKIKQELLAFYIQGVCIGLEKIEVVEEMLKDMARARELKNLKRNRGIK